MAEHRVSQALPEQQKAQDIKEPVGESPSATESQKTELPTSNETLIAFPSSVLDQGSFCTPQFPLCFSLFSKFFFFFFRKKL